MDGNDEGTVIGEQVRHAGRGKGWSPDELARHAGLDRATVDGVEAGGRRTGVLELTRLARALDVPVDYLLRPRPAVISHRAELLEEESDTEADRSLQRIEVALSSWLRDVRQLVEAGTLHPNPPVTYPRPVASQANAREVAMWLRERHGAGTAPIESMLDFNERSGQYVLVTELPGEGASLIDGDLAVAVVNTMDQPGRRRSTAAHELGHLVLGDEYSADLAVHQAREEREAMIHAFAAELLLPRQAFGTVPDGSETEIRRALVVLSARYRTSWSMTLRQAQEAGWIDAGLRRRMHRVPTKAEILEAVGWSPRPDLDDIRVPPSYSNAVMGAWRDDLISDSRAVELMHGTLDVDDLEPRDDSELAP